MFCRNCGKQIDENMDYCRNCGENVKNFYNKYDYASEFKKKDRIVDALNIVNIIYGIMGILVMFAACEALM